MFEEFDDDAVEMYRPMMPFTSLLDNVGRPAVARVVLALSASLWWAGWHTGYLAGNRVVSPCWLAGEGEKIGPLH
ncbi:hypothetical protein [Actinocorallia lasiicapitis]